MKDIITVAAVNFRVDAADKDSNLSRMCGFAESAARISYYFRKCAFLGMTTM